MLWWEDRRSGLPGGRLLLPALRARWAPSRRLGPQRRL